MPNLIPFVFVYFVFKLPHYATSYMHPTGKKESKKRFEKEKKKSGYENFASKVFEPGPSESIRTKS